MSSESDYKPAASEPASSDDQRHVRREAVSHPPSSPRKRRRTSRSTSRDDSTRNPKRRVEGKYNDGYRVLFNESVASAAARVDLGEDVFRTGTQIGASMWTAKESSVFFAALGRLGKDDSPGIADAIGTKSIPEVKELLLLLHDASLKRGDTNVAFEDIPAAIDIGPDCAEQLEMAADALAWYQEKFEAKQEQQRYGEHWLITPEIAGQVEGAFLSSRPQSRSSETPAPPAGGQETVPQILQDIPEGKLIKLSALLSLSQSLFMNNAPTASVPWPHWSDLVSELASEPSIYRSALNDFHTLVLSLTKRITQVAIFQATSRIRAHGWRLKKGVGPIVKTRDVLTAIDVLGLKRNGNVRWTGLARRCGLRVFDGGRYERKEVSWDEAERLLGSMDASVGYGDTDTETAGLTSGAEDAPFKSRAMRSGTPLPSSRPVSSSSEGEDDADDADQENEHEHDTSDADDSAHEHTLAFSNPSSKTPEVQTNTAETFDQEASQQQDSHLRHLLRLPSPKADYMKLAAHGTDPDPDPDPDPEASDRIVPDTADWRIWTDYHAPWEDSSWPVPLAKFHANRRLNQAPTPHDGENAHAHSNANAASDTDSPSSSSSTDGRGGSDRTRPAKKKRRKPRGVEIPIRGATAYAALQERAGPDADADDGGGPSMRVDASDNNDHDDDADDDDAKYPTPSIEGAGLGVIENEDDGVNEHGYEADEGMDSE